MIIHANSPAAVTRLGAVRVISTNLRKMGCTRPPVSLYSGVMSQTHRLAQASSRAIHRISTVHRIRLVHGWYVRHHHHHHHASHAAAAASAQGCALPVFQDAATLWAASFLLPPTGIAVSNQQTTRQPSDGPRFLHMQDIREGRK